VKSVFQYAWKSFGPLEGETFSLVFFPEGSIGGGTALNYSLASEEDLVTSVHEMLHWWTNFQTPAWFREGVHTYLATRLLVKLGIMDSSLFDAALSSFLQEHERVVKREGKLLTLEESSDNYDHQRGGGDMYGLMPLLAYKLDREIQAFRPNAGLEDAFGTAWKKGRQKFDLMALIKEVTGYDADPLFQRYFYARVENPAELLK
jgi:predicted metalloprotease with PDZ domain